MKNDLRRVFVQDGHTYICYKHCHGCERCDACKQYRKWRNSWSVNGLAKCIDAGGRIQGFTNKSCEWVEVLSYEKFIPS